MQNVKPDIDQLYRTLAIIWLVLLFSQFALFGVAWSIGRAAAEANIEHGFLSEMPVIIIGAVLLAATNLVISIVIHRRSIEQAIAEQNVKYVQTGLIIGCALCESISLIGMVLLLAFAYPYFYYWFALGIIGIFLHFPRRQNLINASVK
jgi:F0F1-type ATP synthase membrane subunit c/vacuolar-type H+-ATPase subunit K